MGLNLHINIATTTSLGSLFLLLTILVHQAKTHELSGYSTHRRNLPYQKRASGGNPDLSGPAWHEHPMWQHPALYEGAKLWPSSSESSSKSSTHSSGHSVEITGSKPADHEVTSGLDKGKAVASGSSTAGAGGGEDISRKKLGRPFGVKDSAPRAAYTYKKEGSGGQRTGRPLGTKDTKPRAPYKLKESKVGKLRGPYKKKPKE
ncbi:unnamed protein product [Sympodiomycopsis kandeliae]